MAPEAARDFNAVLREIGMVRCPAFSGFAEFCLGEAGGSAVVRTRPPWPDPS